MNNKNKINSKVNFYFTKHTAWKEELTALRVTILSCGLIEECKWGVPCYTLEKHNIVLLHAFKEYVAVFFFKGVLMKDTHRILVQQTKNVQAGRQMRFTSLADIRASKKLLKEYIDEAMEIEKSGKTVNLKKTKDFNISEEFQYALDHNEQLKIAFQKLTGGRQREYLLYFSSAKQSSTRVRRIEKCVELILDNMGLHD